jgi:hypothetical protein
MELLKHDPVTDHMLNVVGHHGQDKGAQLLLKAFVLQCGKGRGVGGGHGGF